MPAVSSLETQSGSLRRPAAWLAGKLSRVTSTHDFIPEVDGLRFVALLPVLFLHSATHFLIWRGWRDFSGNWTTNQGLILRAIGLGALGVQVFFVISGFVVALPFARHWLAGAPKPAPGRYFMRRLTRIEPPYVIALVAMYLLWRNYRGYLLNLLAGLIYSHQFIFGAPNNINIVTWTLEIEVTFYLLAPWLANIYRIPGNYCRWALQIVLMGLYSTFFLGWLHGHCPQRLNNTLLTQLPYFQAGILLADLYVCGAVRRSRRLVWDFAAVAGAALLLYFCSVAYRFYWTSPMLLMVIFLGGMQGRVFNAFLRLRPITIIGGMCYSAYLWHSAMLVLLRAYVAPLVPHSLPDGPAALLFCFLMVPVLIVLTAPIFYFVEKPFMNGLGSRWIERTLRAAVAPLQRKPAIAPSEVAR
jgi:peptidoglycan/LPS O-acetylase OafA/YrhL